LLAAVTVNRRTGHLLAGHQRLAALDALEQGGDYELDVAMTDMDLAVEQSQNVFMNNPAVQGGWDLDALGSLMRAPDFDIEASGFDPMDVQVMFDDRELAPMFNTPGNAAVMDDIERIGAVAHADAAPLERAPAADDDALDDDAGEPATDDANTQDDDDHDDLYDDADSKDDGPAENDASARDPATVAAAEKAKWTAIKQRQKARIAQHIREDDTEFYTVIGFSDPAQRAVFCQLMRLEPNATHVQGARVFAKLKRAG
jgi:hypothetical protein